MSMKMRVSSRKVLKALEQRINVFLEDCQRRRRFDNYNCGEWMTLMTMTNALCTCLGIRHSTGEHKRLTELIDSSTQTKKERKMSKERLASLAQQVKYS